MRGAGWEGGIAGRYYREVVLQAGGFGTSWWSRPGLLTFKLAAVLAVALVAVSQE